MLMLGDILGAHFSARLDRMHVRDELALPGWLDRRLGWFRRQDLRRFEHAERSAERGLADKDPARDW